MSIEQFGRKASLVLVQGDGGLDLSQLRFRFNVKAMDAESPTNAEIRVYNLSDDTVKRIRGEYSRVVLQAGYEGNFGVIFDGTIKQYRIGRENGTDTYLDILAADGDTAYNFALVNRTLRAGSTSLDRINAAIDAMAPKGVTAGNVLIPNTGGTLPRGKVLWGLARAALRGEAESNYATWNIDKGKVQVIPRKAYAPGEVVVLNGRTGLIGRPEQTVDGIRARCLINPAIVVGGRVQIDNAAINQTLQQNPDAAPVPYNQWAGLQLLANIAADGVYRVFVIEYEGDTRANAWYAELTLLAIDQANNQVVSP